MIKWRMETKMCEKKKRNDKEPRVYVASICKFLWICFELSAILNDETSRKQRRARVGIWNLRISRGRTCIERNRKGAHEPWSKENNSIRLDFTILFTPGCTENEPRVRKTHRRDLAEEEGSHETSKRFCGIDDDALRQTCFPLTRFSFNIFVTILLLIVRTYVYILAYA